ncbi:MAG TPA: GNAT family N-acetyltransferase [Gammaproteobacteria bacterium]|nr:GNAT family N-acetyltransferase [Gammaproteobacteria bacterium]
MNGQHEVVAVHPQISVRPLRESDLDGADRIMRLAFGTFLGLPDPGTFMGDAGFVRTRWRADPAAAFGADAGETLVGSNFAAHWGSVGFFGPLTVHPNFWDRGVAKALMEPVMQCFERWGTRHAGLFTFAHSAKHVGLYQRFGFWPRFLTAIMSKRVQPAGRKSEWTTLSAVPQPEQLATLAACRELTDAVLEGLNVGSEIRAIAEQGLGDTVLVFDGGRLVGLAACHHGPGTEAGGGTCYVKFGAVRPGPAARVSFGRLLDACEEFAAANGLSRLEAGNNTARHEAYRSMLERGFRTDLQGLAMQRPNDAGYNRPGAFVIDDWR